MSWNCRYFALHAKAISGSKNRMSRPARFVGATKKKTNPEHWVHFNRYSKPQQ